MPENQNIVVVDTNILCNTPLLQDAALQSFSENAVERRIKVVVPEVVIMETVNVVRRNWQEELRKLSILRINSFGVRDELERIASAGAARIASYEGDLLARLDVLGFDVVPVPNISHMEIARRASESTAPYLANSTKENYRDTLIWLTVLDIAKKKPDDIVWFLSNNHKDFGNKTERSNGIDRFSPGLLRELADRRLKGRVRYASDLDALEQHFASQWAPIETADLSARKATLRMSLFTEFLSRTVIGFPLDPNQTGMPDNVIRAHIIGAATEDEGWKFDEAAGRGEGRWTAKFVVPVEVDISTIESPGATNEYTKTLNIAGVVTIDTDGSPISLAILSAVALPGDEVQERTERRTNRAERRLAESVVWGTGKSFAVDPGLVSGIGKSFAVDPGLVSGIGKSFAVDPGVGDIPNADPNEAEES
ncbi:PIN domain-containing protein [Rhodococcus qingshengii]|uniref:PIN domain-containing protein n=1 Tax=Rhodococcus qingshengii TaxID=334542 RepID=UPI0037C7DB03